MKKFPYDLKSFALISATWGVIVFPLAFLTMFYYLIFYGLSMLIFGGMNFYFQGVLAGGTGAIWGYFVPKGIEKQKEISKNVSKYSPQKYLALLKKRNKVWGSFLLADIALIVFIRVFHLY